MISLVVVIALIYLRQVYLFYKGWHNLKVYGTDFSPKVSVVIALRNEEVNILIKYPPIMAFCFHVILAHVWNQKSDNSPCLL